MRGRKAVSPGKTGIVWLPRKKTPMQDAWAFFLVTSYRFQVSGFPPEAGPPSAEKLATCDLKLVACKGEFGDG